MNLKTDGYLLRVDPFTKARWEAYAEEEGIPLSEYAHTALGRLTKIMERKYTRNQVLYSRFEMRLAVKRAALLAAGKIQPGHAEGGNMGTKTNKTQVIEDEILKRDEQEKLSRSLTVKLADRDVACIEKAARSQDISASTYVRRAVRNDLRAKGIMSAA